MNDAFGAFSTIVLGILAGYGVVGWVRSQTNKARQDLEVEVSDLKRRTADYARVTSKQAGQIKFLQDENASLRKRLAGAELRARTQPFGTYPSEGTGPVPPVFADGNPTSKGADRSEYHETRKATEKELREMHQLPRLPNCQP